MSISVIVPQIGQSIVEAVILKWLKKPGDRVKKGEALVEIGTDKINTELPAPESGIVERLLAQEGETVPVNAEIATLATESGAPAVVGRVEPEPATPVSGVEPAGREESRERTRSSPLVRKLAQEHNIDLSLVKGSGADDRVTRDDLLRAIEERDAQSASVRQKEPVHRVEPATEKTSRTASADTERAPMSRMRKLIAEHMILSRQTAADVTTFFEIDMAEVVKQRDKAKSTLEAQYSIKLTYLPFIIAAAARALRAYPIVNASIDRTEIVYKKNINIGIAVALENGLIVPVIRNVDEIDIVGLARAAQDLSERARANRLTPLDLEDGTFTITNPGVFGALMGTPIIHQPQMAILGVGAVVQRVVVINDAMVIRPMAFFSLSYDHRAVDGAVADRFLAHIKHTLETECPSATS
jgi:2-oxoglutarate dehydrogenase E2 component (dihydrolipoamide succinyltransferase)